MLCHLDISFSCPVFFFGSAAMIELDPVLRAVGQWGPVFSLREVWLGSISVRVLRVKDGSKASHPSKGIASKVSRRAALSGLECLLGSHQVSLRTKIFNPAGLLKAPGDVGDLDMVWAWSKPKPLQGHSANARGRREHVISWKGSCQVTKTIGIVDGRHVYYRKYWK